MRRLVSGSISVRIAILSVIPMLALTGVGANTLLTEHSKADTARAISQSISVTPVISGLAHELQKERGASAGFISSNGKKFIQTIATSRQNTDKALEAYRATFATHATLRDLPGFEGAFSKMTSALEKLVSVRKKIDALSLPVGQMATYYTSSISNLLTMVESVAKVADEGSVLHSLAAYTSLLQGKERAGQERAMGTAGFGAGTFKPQIFRNFIKFGAMQNTYFSIFYQHAGKKQVVILKKALSNSAQSEFNSMRKIAGTSPFGGDISSVSGIKWYNTSTRRINALKTIEDQIGKNIVARSLAIADRSNTNFWTLAIVLSGLLALIAFISVLITRSISRPINKLTCNMRELAKNNTTVQAAGVERQDEIGEMARAVEVFRENAIKNKQLEAEQCAQKLRVESEKAAMMIELADNFDASVGGIVGTVSAASAELQSTASSMAEISEQTSSQAVSVSTASQQASTNVQTVAAATEEMSSTINEISQQVVEATNASRQAVEEVRMTGEQMNELAINANKIGEVIELISDIAEQTNLLALNATIESARAGEAGRGFAVVASEVKNLASQTARATDEIAQQIGDVQTATQKASASMEDVGRSIGKVDEISTAIAAAMEEQSAATSEIASNVSQAAMGTQQVNDNISLVTQASQEAGAASSEVMSAAGELSQQAELLKGEVDKFIHQVRAG